MLNLSTNARKILNTNKDDYKTPRKPKNSSSKVYLYKDDLYYEIVLSKSTGKLTRTAEKMLILIAKETIRRLPYSSEDTMLDCYQMGLWSLFKNWLSFDEEKFLDPFSYYTEIFKRGTNQGFNELNKKKGDDSAIIISIESSNDGNGMMNV